MALFASHDFGCDVQVAEALRERAQRIYEKYGNVMLETEGMTKAGIERKATCRALFSKLLYLAGMCKPVQCDLRCNVAPGTLRLATHAALSLQNTPRHANSVMTCSVSFQGQKARDSVYNGHHRALLAPAESDKILAQDSEVAEKLKLPDIFGATEDDTSSLRIVSLYEVSYAAILQA